ncbi:MAG: HDOD domain-containing protein [Rhodoferax sp.]|nr:MAG: HDOD domain-containing protein [Rhodoferax sp.]
MHYPTITEEVVLANADALPAFPKTVRRILETVDDPDSSMSVLADVVGRDPAIAGRVLALANTAASVSKRRDKVEDIYAATALVGMQQVRDVALVCSLSKFVREMEGQRGQSAVWCHSVGVGVCAQELAVHTHHPVSSSHALIAGLLHDIGQFWLMSFLPDIYPGFWKESIRAGVEITRLEKTAFGASHAQIGDWLTRAWQLPWEICDAIRWHHRPEGATSMTPLIALVHVAEVLSNALELGGAESSKVGYLSPRASEALGITWSDGVHTLFGRIEARSRYVNDFFNQ